MPKLKAKCLRSKKVPEAESKRLQDGDTIFTVYFSFYCIAASRSIAYEDGRLAYTAEPVLSIYPRSKCLVHSLVR